MNEDWKNRNARKRLLLMFGFTIISKERLAYYKAMERALFADKPPATPQYIEHEIEQAKFEIYNEGFEDGQSTPKKK